MNNAVNKNEIECQKASLAKAWSVSSSSTQQTYKKTFLFHRLQSSQEAKAYEEAGKIATEATLNLRTVASLTKEEKFFKNYEKSLNVPYE